MDVIATGVRSAALTDDEVVALYERTVDEVHRYASRLTGNDRAATEELVQETYLALVRRSRERDLGPVELGWLIVTCRSRFLDQLRSARRRDHREQVVLRDRSGVGAGSGATAVRSGGEGDADDVLAGLPTDQRTALVLRYVDELSVPEIARSLGRSVHATESLLARGRSRLRSVHRPERGLR